MTRLRVIVLMSKLSDIVQRYSTKEIVLELIAVNIVLIHVLLFVVTL
jgi:hypothetical protein